MKREHSQHKSFHIPKMIILLRWMEASVHFSSSSVIHKETGGFMPPVSIIDFPIIEWNRLLRFDQ